MMVRWMDVRDSGMNARLSSPSPALNVKCLTGRLSEEELQRGVAALQPGGGKHRVHKLDQAAYFTSGCLSFPPLHQVHRFQKELNDLTESRHIIVIMLHLLLDLQLREIAENMDGFGTDPSSRQVLQDQQLYRRAKIYL